MELKMTIVFQASTPEKLLAGIAALPEKLLGFVSVYSVEEYNGVNIFTSEDGLSGFAIKADGELISVFSSVAGRGREILAAAVASGARKLDCFEDAKSKHLTKLYSEFGFVEVGRVAWDDQYAPKVWDYTKFGRPDVVFMEVK
jgi:hypothetical protein